MGDWKNPFDKEPKEPEQKNEEEEEEEQENPFELEEILDPYTLEDQLKEGNWKSLRYITSRIGNYSLSLTIREDYTNNKFKIKPKIKIHYPDGSTLEQKSKELTYENPDIYAIMLPKVLRLYRLTIEILNKEKKNE